jgi:hypothetical protein
MIAALPGLREIRSALAGGYLWLLFLWLLFDPSLGRADFAGEPFRSARHAGETVGPVAKGVAVTFVAYLLGTFVNEGRSVMSRVYLYARQSENFTPDIARTRLSVRLEDRLRSRRQPSWRLKRKSYFRAVFEQSYTFRYRRYELVSRVTLACLKFLERVISMLGSGMRAAAMAFAVPVIAVEVAGLALLRSIISMRAEPYKPFLTPRGVTSLEAYLESAGSLKTNSTVPGIADVIADFPVIRARLIHTSVDTVNEVDRLVSEAEFRSSIVAPLTFLIALLAIDTSLWWLLLWPLLLTLLSAARERRRESGDLLVDALCQGVVTSPALDARPKASQTLGDSNGADKPARHQDLIW